MAFPNSRWHQYLNLGLDWPTETSSVNVDLLGFVEPPHHKDLNKELLSILSRKCATKGRLRSWCKFWSDAPRLMFFYPSPASCTTDPQLKSQVIGGQPCLLVFHNLLSAHTCLELRIAWVLDICKLLIPKQINADCNPIFFVIMLLVWFL